MQRQRDKGKGKPKPALKATKSLSALEVRPMICFHVLESSVGAQYQSVAMKQESLKDFAEAASTSQLSHVLVLRVGRCAATKVTPSDLYKLSLIIL